MDISINKQHFKRVYNEYIVVCVILSGFIVIPPIMLGIPGVLAGWLFLWFSLFKNKGKSSLNIWVLMIYLCITAAVDIFYGFIDADRGTRGIVMLGVAILPLFVFELWIILDKALIIQKFLGFCDYHDLLYVKRHRKYLQSQARKDTSNGEKLTPVETKLFELSDDNREFICQNIENALFVMYPKNKRIGICYIISLLMFACILLGILTHDMLPLCLLLGGYAMLATAVMNSEIL